MCSQGKPIQPSLFPLGNPRGDSRVSWEPHTTTLRCSLGNPREVLWIEILIWVQFLRPLPPCAPCKFCYEQREFLHMPGKLETHEGELVFSLGGRHNLACCSCRACSWGLPARSFVFPGDPREVSLRLKSTGSSLGSPLTNYSAAKTSSSSRKSCTCPGGWRCMKQAHILFGRTVHPYLLFSLGSLSRLVK